MTPVTQTILAGDPSGRLGNCLQAAVATLLDMPLGDVPHFAEHEDWLERLADFAAARGYWIRNRPLGAHVARGLAFGPSLRGVKHAIVWIDGAPAWDPHPSRDGLMSVSMLIAFEPATDHANWQGVSMKPSVGRNVHYVSYGTPGGEFESVCRAATITELTGDPDHPDQVGLAVFNPTGQFFNRAVPYDEGGETPGSPECPNPEAHGNPFRYCSCGWMQTTRKGGTWHWPERVE